MELIEFVRKCASERRAAAAGGAGVYAPVAEARSRRQEDRQLTRNRQREDRFHSNRKLEPSKPLKPATPPPRVDPLRRRLEQWQAERRRRKQLMPKPPPPFKAGGAPSLVLPQPPPPHARRRDTRAARRAEADAAKLIPSTYTSFAPPGALFHPPIIRTAQRTPLKLTKAKSKTGRSSIHKIKKGKQTPKKNKPMKSSSRIAKRKDAENVPSPLPIIVKDTVPNVSIVRSNTVEIEVSTGSPFVSVIRGKHRLTDHLSSVAPASPEKSANYFRSQLDGEISRLIILCDEWKNYKDCHDELIEDHKDMIDVAVGQTKLLINKKFQQFKGLIEKCENQEASEAGLVKIQDLQGFWDMIYMQVENLDIRFNELKELKSKDWKEEVSIPIVLKSKKIPKSTKNVDLKPKKKSGGLRAMIQAARLKSQETSNVESENDSIITFNGGFFSVTSPLKQISENKKSTPRDSIHKSVLSLERNKRLSMTPLKVVAVLTASSISKNITNDQSPIDEKFMNLNKTPAKSILKTPNNNKKNSSVNVKNIKVLFANDGSDISEEKLVDISLPEVESVSSTKQKSSEKRKSRRRVAKQKCGDENSFSIETQIENSTEKKRKKRAKNSKNNEDVLVNPFKNENLLQENTPNKKLESMQYSTNLKSEPSRLSFNLISFESPARRTLMTRSMSKNTTNLDNQ
ncbi:uncharacterized protein LOC143911569 isoform X2 [Arctopsyche grandis]|uniref:uncharacterized protein LOC143911569 isoform X2 n=1 Tax=Arctopsyche grandis TaxID=121162 RepID=UPI00406DA342